MNTDSFDYYLISNFR